jgi:hypothetical protein
VHGVDIESEHGEFRCAVSVREADRVGESRTDFVLGNHHDVPSVLLHIPGDRQIHAVRFVPVTVVTTENTAALERIISHVRRLRVKRLSRVAGGSSPPFQSNDIVTLSDHSPRSVPEPATREQSQHGSCHQIGTLLVTVSQESTVAVTAVRSGAGK